MYFWNLMWVGLTNLPNHLWSVVHSRKLETWTREYHKRTIHFFLITCRQYKNHTLLYSQEQRTKYVTFQILQFLSLDSDHIAFTAKCGYSVWSGGFRTHLFPLKIETHVRTLPGGIFSLSFCNAQSGIYKWHCLKCAGRLVKHV